MPVGSVSAVNSTVALSTDPRDLNGDGKVTAAEIQAYAIRQAKLKKPEATVAAAPTEAQAQQEIPPSLTGRIDLYA
jgi:hypothetical protein